MLKKIILITTSLLLVACTSGEPTPTPLSQDDVLSTAVASIIETQTAASTPIPAPTQPPTQIPPSETPSQSNEKQFSWNYLATQDSGGVVITIARVVIGEKTSIPIDFSSFAIFNNTPVVVEIIFIVENKTSGVIGVYPDQGKALLGSEQIDLFQYAVGGGDLGTPYSGDVLPGAKLIGGLWFGLQRTTLSEINSMTIFFSPPHDQSFSRLGPDYNFVLDLSNKQFIPIPEELK